MIEQLIIIGNGFDLACDLKSSYGQWYRRRFNGNGHFRKFLNWFIGSTDADENSQSNSSEIKSVFDKIMQGNFTVPSSKQKITAWDIILLQHKKSSGEWKSIEELIERVLTKKDDLVGDIFQIGKNERKELFGFINEETAEKYENYPKYGIRPVIKLLSQRYRDPKFLYKILECKKYAEKGGFREVGNAKDEQRIYELMLNELKFLELEFATYLKAEIKKK